MPIRLTNTTGCPIAMLKKKNKFLSERVIIALDGMSAAWALRIARELQGLVWGFKVTDLLFEDIAIIRKLKKFGHVFADAKLYDIPNTVKNSVAKLSAAGADFITVHASGGVEMMRAAKANVGKSKIIAITVLTSKGGNVKKEVLRLVNNAKAAGVDGVVCSAVELALISRVRGLIKVVPGIRPLWYKNWDDQKRTATPAEAIRQGADFIVIGRPVTKAKNSRTALECIIAEI